MQERWQRGDSTGCGDTCLRTWCLKIQQLEAAAGLSAVGPSPCGKHRPDWCVCGGCWGAVAVPVLTLPSKAWARASFESGYTFTCLHLHLLNCSTEASISSLGALFARKAQAGKTLYSLVSAISSSVIRPLLPFTSAILMGKGRRQSTARSS